MDLTTRLFLRRPPTPVFHGVLRFRRALRSARARLMPVNAEIIERTLALVEVRAIGLAAELDLAEHVASRPRTSGELATLTATDPDALDRLLHLLASTGFFKLGKDGAWSNTRLSSGLRADHPLSARSWARFFGGGDLVRVWGDADVSVRTGRAADERDFFAWAGTRFNEAMREGSKLLALSLARTVDVTGVSTVCDVGGGTGGLLHAVVDRHRGVRGVLFDLPDVVGEAPAHDRIETVGGSFFESVPPGADRYVLVSVVHDWDDERALAILQRCVEALPEGGRIWVVEQVLEPEAPPFLARHSDVLMLVLTGAGRERTDEHLRDLFGRAGLDVARTYELATLHRVYELALATT